jgi:hypothetical protein
LHFLMIFLDQRTEENNIWVSFGATERKGRDNICKIVEEKKKRFSIFVVLQFRQNERTRVVKDDPQNFPSNFESRISREEQKCKFWIKPFCILHVFNGWKKKN